MDLVEFKAKELFERHGLPGPVGRVAASRRDLEEIDVGFPCMIKAQVPVGGRGKAGGVRAAADKRELAAALDAVIGMTIRGHKVEKALIVGQAAAEREWYLSMVLDRALKTPAMVFSTCGGIDIEDAARATPDKIVRLPLDPLRGPRPHDAEYLLDKGGAGDARPAGFFSFLNKLHEVFRREDCLLCEVNPLAVTADGSLLALDAKISVDDNALFRHPDLLKLRDETEPDPLVTEARGFGFLYIPCDRDAGDVGVVSNGSGMIMSTMDALGRDGKQVASALDLGGGATAERISEAVRIMLSDPAVGILFINIFGGITRCDEVAGGIKSFLDAQGSGKPMVIRFEGTHKEAGMQILKSMNRADAHFADGLLDGVKAVLEMSPPLEKKRETAPAGGAKP